MREWWEDVEDAHGDINIYRGGRDEPSVEFRVRFTNGMVQSVTEIEIESRTTP